LGNRRGGVREPGFGRGTGRANGPPRVVVPRRLARRGRSLAHLRVALRAARLAFTLALALALAVAFAFAAPLAAAAATMSTWAVSALRDVEAPEVAERFSQRGRVPAEEQQRRHVAAPALAAAGAAGGAVVGPEGHHGVPGAAAGLPVGTRAGPRNFPGRGRGASVEARARRSPPVGADSNSNTNFIAEPRPHACAASPVHTKQRLTKNDVALYEIAR
jgi:hypothetical protein